MEKPARYKAKTKKPAPKPKTAKKRKSDGPSCSMFLAEITRKLALKKRQEEEAPKNVVQTIIDSIANALPIKISRKSPPKVPSPTKIETLQSFAPELIPIPNESIVTVTSAPLSVPEEVITEIDPEPTVSQKPTGFKMPRMPLVSSEVLKNAVLERKKKFPMHDQAVNTGTDHDVASEISKHVSTLRKISLIAEEFNQKTAKSLKEIVDSVQDDLLKKLEEIQAEQKSSEATTASTAETSLKMET